MRWIGAAAAAALVSGALGPPAAAGVRSAHVDAGAADRSTSTVRIVELVPAPQDGAATAKKISDRGVVIGDIVSASSPSRQAFRWEDGKLVILAGLDGAGSADVTAHDVNARGQVVGTSATSDGRVRAALWEPDGTIVDLGPRGQDSVAVGINRRGTVAGQVIDAAGRSQAVIWKNGVPVPLGDFGRGSTTVAFTSGPTINDSDEVAGVWFRPDGMRAFRWDEDRGIVELATPEGWQSWPIAINRRGEIAGQMTGPVEGEIKAVVWDDEGAVIELPGFGVPGVMAQAMNDRGDVVGVAPTADGFLHAFLYRDGQMILLGTPGGPEGDARAVNRRGQVVGTSSIDGFDRATLWDDGQVIDLGVPDGQSTSVAQDINSRGQVVGYSSDAVGLPRSAVLWVRGTRDR